MFKRTLSILLIVLLGLLIANKALFTHTHTLANGKTVAHAHPFNKHSDKKHQHSGVEFAFFAQLDLLFIVTIALVAKPIEYYAGSFLVQKAQSFIDISHRVISGRAPPVLF